MRNYMRNCDFWDRDEVPGMYDKYCGILNRNQNPTLLQWLYKRADTALQTDVGQILQMSGRYSVGTGTRMRFVYVRITGYKEDSNPDLLDGIHYPVFHSVNYIDSDGGGSWTNVNRLLRAGTPIETVTEAGLLKLPSVPEELMKMLAPERGVDLGSVKEKCPFRDEWKTPVPPCMKKEED